MYFVVNFKSGVILNNLNYFMIIYYTEKYVLPVVEMMVIFQ